MLACQGLPEQDADGPDVGRRGRDGAAQPFRGDVGESAGDVAECGQRVELRHLGEPEVEQPDVDRVCFGEQHVRRFHVAVDDSAAVGVGERVADLRRYLDRRAVVELSGSHRLTQRSPRHVLVGDVDVRRVVGERANPLAARMAKRRGRSGLALGAMSGLAVPGDDLQGDVEP